MIVGNKAIEGSWDNTFEQECSCRQFPCDCYEQDINGDWRKNE